MYIQSVSGFSCMAAHAAGINSFVRSAATRFEEHTRQDGSSDRAGGNHRSSRSGSDNDEVKGFRHLVMSFPLGPLRSGFDESPGLLFLSSSGGIAWSVATPGSFILNRTRFLQRRCLPFGGVDAEPVLTRMRVSSASAQTERFIEEGGLGLLQWPARGTRGSRSGWTSPARFFIEADAAVEDDAARTIAAATTDSGRIDVLVNNAGGATGSAGLETVWLRRL